jgi:hypothetical protein
MARIAGAAEFALSAARIYLTNNTPANKLAISPVFDCADKFVSNCSVETSVTTSDL